MHDHAHNAQHSAEWHNEVKLGACQALAHFRRLLAGEAPLSRDDREGLRDMLMFMEEHLLTMWQLVDEDERLTRAARDKIRPV